MGLRNVRSLGPCHSEPKGEGQPGQYNYFTGFPVRTGHADVFVLPSESREYPICDLTLGRSRKTSRKRNLILLAGTSLYPFAGRGS